MDCGKKKNDKEMIIPATKSKRDSDLQDVLEKWIVVRKNTDNEVTVPVAISTDNCPDSTDISFAITCATMSCSNTTLPTVVPCSDSSQSDY